MDHLRKLLLKSESAPTAASDCAYVVEQHDLVIVWHAIPEVEVGIRHMVSGKVYRPSLTDFMLLELGGTTSSYSGCEQNSKIKASVKTCNMALRRPALCPMKTRVIAPQQ